MTKWQSTLLAVWLSAVFVAAAPGASPSWDDYAIRRAVITVRAGGAAR